MGRKIVPGHPIHLSDDEGAALGFWYDAAAADRAVEFFPRFLRHGKGKWANKPFYLLPWQEDDVIRPLFGWKRLAAEGEEEDLAQSRKGAKGEASREAGAPRGREEEPAGRPALPGGWDRFEDRRKNTDGGSEHGNEQDESAGDGDRAEA